MKIAISGKGGAGKTTVASILAKIYSKDKKVILIDCDPDANLGENFGFKCSSLTPLVEMKELITERVNPSPFGTYKLNPEVSDIPERYFLQEGNIKFMIMGTIRDDKTGCFCPENTFIRALLAHLVLEREEVLILDMPAGIEHLTRGTSKGVDILIIVVEPTFKSLESATRILKISKNLEIKKITILANKIRNQEDRDFISNNLNNFTNFSGGFLPYDEKLEELEKDKKRWSREIENTIIFREIEKILKESIKS